MKRDKYIITIFCVLIIMLLGALPVLSQNIVRIRYYTKQEAKEYSYKSKYYNLKFSDLYFVVQDDTFFIPQIGVLEFNVPHKIDSIITAQNSVSFLAFLHNKDCIYEFFIVKERYIRNKNGISFSITKNKYGWYRAVGYGSLVTTSKMIRYCGKKNQWSHGSK